MGFGPLLGWKRGDLGAALQRLTFAVAASITVIVVVYWADAGRQIFAALAMGLAAWIIASAAVEWGERVALFRAPLGTVWSRMRNLPRASWGMTIAHAGVGLMVMGIAGISAWQTEVIRLVKAGDAFDVVGYRFVFKGVEQQQGPNFFATRATFEVYEDNRLYAVLKPARRFFPVSGTSTTETAIRTNLFADLYATIGDPELPSPIPNMPAFLAPTDAATQWTARIYHNPLVPWIWLGACIMALGGIVSLTDRRHRVGAPRRAALPPVAPQGAPQAAE
jgi:cytochrome c-type biogenesis protein CcmF